MSEPILERVREDTKAAMKAGERERVGTLRMLTSALQLDEKEGKGDAVAVLQRERKKRVEAANAFESGGRDDQAAAERAEAELIESYLPAQLSDAELAAIVGSAVESTGATSVKEMGKVIGAVMAEAQGRADGKRVSTMVRERLGA
ncbi:MAG TPA: GatB/YqeY domain-containing protein [Solirubrobacterales bacterium]|nr:GatB/YqeY domain-containing protein [Solirubrobacterales bacterium]